MTTAPSPPDRGLDWLNLLLSASGAAYGAFIPVYLTGKAWTQTQIGLVLTIGMITAMVCLLPAGLLIDAQSRHRRRILAVALALGSAAPLLLAAWPNLPLVTVAVVLQSAVASIFSPAIAGISLGVAGHDTLGERLGRNARYGSIGAGVGAAALGVCGIWGGDRGVFVIAAAFSVGSLLALRWVGPDQAAPAIDAPETTPGPASAGPSRPGAAGPRAASTVSPRIASPPSGTAPSDSPPSGPAPPDVRPEENWKAARHLLRDRRVIVFGLCIALFQIASIAVVQLAAVEATRRLGSRAGLVIAAFVIVPQIVVAWIAPMISRFAQSHGRRRVLLAGFATVPVRNACFAVITHPVGLVPIQALEGAGGAVFGVMLPLIAADVTRHGGFYTTCMSLFGLASSLGSAVSSSVAGWSADRFGRPATYLLLAALGALATLILALAMPETGRTRPRPAPTAGQPAPR